MEQRQELAGRGHERRFWDKYNILSLDRCLGQIDIFICPDSNVHLKLENLVAYKGCHGRKKYRKQIQNSKNKCAKVFREKYTNICYLLGNVSKTQMN